MLLKCRTHKLRRELSLFAKIIVTCRADGFIQNLLQLKQVLEMRYGVMVVRKAGKSVWKKLDSTKGEMYFIYPKVISKERLYGSFGRCNP